MRHRTAFAIFSRIWPACCMPDAGFVVARELTKKFESFDAMTASDLPDWAQAHEPRGEYAVIVDMQDKNEEVLDAKDLKWLRAIAEEMPKSRAAALAAKVTGMKRDTIYQMLNA